MEVSSGSSGVRGVVNRGFTAELALHLGKIVGDRYGGVIAVASDTRLSGSTLKSAVCAGLMSVGADVLDLGVMPTSALQYYVRSHGYVDGGVMVTASHNPPEYNGVKAIGRDGIEDPFLMGMPMARIEGMATSVAPWDGVGDMSPADGGLPEYIDAILSNVDVEAVSAAKLKVCVECVDGVASVVVPMLMQRMDVEAIILNNSPRTAVTELDTDMSRCMDEVGRMTKITGCDVGAVFDMDADRCLFTDSEGRPVPGDKSFIMLAKSVLAGKGGKVVTSVSSSSAVEIALEPAGAMVMRVPVGSPNIVRKVMDYGAAIGGETNGGVVFPNHQLCRDALMALAKMLECVAVSGPVSKQAELIPTYEHVEGSVDCPDSLKGDLSNMFMELFRGSRTDITDGVKVFFDDGWVLTRPSGTVPAFRVYSQSTDGELARSRLNQYLDTARDFLEKRALST